MKKFSYITLVILGLLLAIGCAPEDKKDDGIDHDLYKRELYQSDIKTLESTETIPELIKFDQNNRNIISKIFGGTRGIDLVSYLKTRVSLTYTEKELKNARQKVASRTGVSYKATSADSDTMVGAMNIGTALWLQSLEDRTNVTVNFGGQITPITSSRVGIVVFGEGYARTNSQGKEYPAEMRNMIMVHEARHSDCTGGITEADVELLRKAKDNDIQATGFTKFSCGHTHQKCPSNHQYAGKLICDVHPWGSYAIGAIYVKAMLPKYEDGSFERSVLNALYIDQKNRALNDVDQMLNGAFGDPNMSSSGYTGGND